MEDIFIDHRLGVFFGVLVLFFSVVGVLGYIPKQLIINAWFLVVFIIGIILGGMLIERGISPYFTYAKSNALKIKTKRRR